MNATDRKNQTNFDFPNELRSPVEFVYTQTLASCESVGCIMSMCVCVDGKTNSFALFDTMRCGAALLKIARLWWEKGVRAPQIAANANCLQ